MPETTAAFVHPTPHFIRRPQPISQPAHRKTQHPICAVQRPAVVVGAGLAGLSAANVLARAGVPVKILDASDDVGGRVRSDFEQGFILDRGFQVFIEGYPECQKWYVVYMASLFYCYVCSTDRIVRCFCFK